MPTVSRDLPDRPHLDVPRREARELLALWRDAQPEALDRIRRRHPRFREAADAAIAAGDFRLADAQLVLAGEYGFANWPGLKHHIAARATIASLAAAIHAGERATVERLLRAEPHLLHVPVVSGNWGPPMSHAANLGRLEIVQACAALGASDHQHAFDRALLQGRIECARWLHAHGAKLAPGIVMGSCETQKADGLRLLAELGAPFADAAGNRLAPLALLLETYGRNPAGKHACLEILAAQGYVLPDTPMMAFHRGRVDLLERALQHEPGLLTRRFAYREIYPPELGCAADERAGLHGTPIAGGTLLHLAVDFEEREIFDWLLARGADPDARGAIDGEGFGGHTPLFHAVVNCGCAQREAAGMAEALLARGASAAKRASLRKFLDWRAEPAWHEVRDVTPVEWARGFPERGWVNHDALRLLE